MELLNFIKLKIHEVFERLNISKSNKMNDNIKIEYKIIQDKIIEPEKQLFEINTNVKEETIAVEYNGFRDNKIFECNIDSYRYKLENSILENYSTRVVEEPALNNIFHDFNKKVLHIERGSLNLFEQLEVDYFEELEKHEALYGDVIKFGHSSTEEIGFETEEKVHIELYKLDENFYKVINNVMIPSCNGKTSQIDTIIISTYGIFVIETKHREGNVVGSEDSEHWECYYGKVNGFKKKHPSMNLRKEFFNPIKQNNSHILALNALLKRFNDVPYYSIIVFNEEAQLHVETLTHVIHISNLIDLLDNYNVQVINELTVKEIYNEVLDNNILNVKAIEDHKEYVKNIQRKKNRAFY